METLGSIDVSQSHEALIYCIGALKFLTGNATIAKQLVKKDCVERLATCLNSINKSVSFSFFHLIYPSRSMSCSVSITKI